MAGIYQSRRIGKLTTTQLIDGQSGALAIGGFHNPAAILPVYQGTYSRTGPVKNPIMQLPSPSGVYKPTSAPVPQVPVLTAQSQGLTAQEIAALQSSQSGAASAPAATSGCPGGWSIASDGSCGDPGCIAQGMTGGPYPGCTALASAASLSSPSTWPWYYWAALAVVLYLITK